MTQKTSGLINFCRQICEYFHVESPSHESHRTSLLPNPVDTFRSTYLQPIHLDFYAKVGGFVFADTTMRTQWSPIECGETMGEHIPPPRSSTTSRSQSSPRLTHSGTNAEIMRNLMTQFTLNGNSSSQNYCKFIRTPSLASGFQSGPSRGGDPECLSVCAPRRAFDSRLGLLLCMLMRFRLRSWASAAVRVVVG